MPTYRIRPGFSFQEPDGSIKSGGQLIELGDDIATLHADKVELAEAEAAAEAQPTQSE